MRKVIFPLAFVAASSLAACSFQLRAGTNPNQPSGGQPSSSTAPTPPQATPAKPTGPIRRLGKREPGAPTGPSPTPSSTVVVPPATPTGAPIVSSATVFGSGTPDAAGFKGTLYWIDR